MIYRLINADVMAGLAQLPDESIQCCVTSPPYWGLRDYGTATWEGGDAECNHEGSKPSRRANAIATSGLQGSKETVHASIIYGAECGTCGALRIDAQLGLESTPDAYVAKMVAVFREVRRALRNDGTLWLNVGDSYASNGPGSWGSSDKSTLTTGSRKGAWAPGKTIGATPSRDCGSLKPKDLVGIPWLLAFALRADGWYLRSDIIWSKPNPMPESVTDRPTKAHEYLFLMTKSARYFYDAAAIAEAFTTFGRERSDNGTTSRAADDPSARFMDGVACAGYGNGHGRNRRTVWTIATEPFPEAHFATFPTALVEPCILAGSKVGDTILDPFSGSGTTGVVALSHQRDYVGIELNADYVAMSRRRLESVAPMFAKEETA